MTVRITRKTLAVAAVLAAVFAASAAYAAIPDGGGVIHGCYEVGTGKLRVTDTQTNVPKTCTSKEAALDWNQQGPKGDTGAKGDPGTSDAYIGTADGTFVPIGTDVISVWLPTGSYVVSAKLQANTANFPNPFKCELTVGGANEDTGYSKPASPTEPAYLTLMTAHTGYGSFAKLHCTGWVTINHAVLTAIKVGELHVW